MYWHSHIARAHVFHWSRATKILTLKIRHPALEAPVSIPTSPPRHRLPLGTVFLAGLWINVALEFRLQRLSSIRVQCQFSLCFAFRRWWGQRRLCSSQKIFKFSLLLSRQGRWRWTVNIWSRSSTYIRYRGWRMRQRYSAQGSKSEKR